MFYSNLPGSLSSLLLPLLSLFCFSPSCFFSFFFPSRVESVIPLLGLWLGKSGGAENGGEVRKGSQSTAKRKITARTLEIKVTERSGKERIVNSEDTRRHSECKNWETSPALRGEKKKRNRWKGKWNQPYFWNKVYGSHLAFSLHSTGGSA